MGIRKNDQVMIIRGAHKGQTGKVIKVFPADNRAIVEARNMIKRHKRPTQRDPKGGVVEKEGPIAVPNLMLVCPKCSTPSRSGAKILEDKRKVRFCKRCKEIID